MARRMCLPRPGRCVRNYDGCISRRVAEKLPWLRLCVKEITATDIGAQYSLLGLLRGHVPPAELLPPPMAKGRQKKRKVLER